MDYAVRASDLNKAERKAPRGSLVSMRQVVSRHLRGLLLASGLLGAGVAVHMGWASQVIILGSDWLSRGAVNAGMVVAQLDVRGAHRTDEDMLLHSVGDLLGRPILSVDLLAIKAHAEELGWVQQAHVTRQLPATINIEIVERVPFALWQMENEVWVIDQAGVKITADAIEEFRNLPFIIGEGAPQAYKEIADVLGREQQLMARVSSLIRVGDRRWDVLFASGARLRLPEPGGAYMPEDAWQRFAMMERDHQLLSREVAVFDMRQPDRMVVNLTDAGEKDLKNKTTQADRST